MCLKTHWAAITLHGSDVHMLICEALQGHGGDADASLGEMSSACSRSLEMSTKRERVRSLAHDTT